MAFNLDVPPPEYIETDAQARELLHLAVRKVEEDPHDLIGFDTETKGLVLPLSSKGRKLDWMNDTVVFWSLSFKTDDRYRRWCLQQQHFQLFAGLLENPKAWLTAWNAKYDGHVSWNSGINIWEANVVDGLALINLFDENRTSNSLKTVAKEYCGLSMTPYKELFKGCRDSSGKLAVEFKTSLLDLPLDRVVNYASYDAYACLRVAEFLIEELKNIPLDPEGKANMYDHFLEMELDFTEVLWRMERRGMLIDIDYLNEQIPKIEKAISKLEREINRAAGQVVSMKSAEGKQININAPKQLAHLFFGPKKEGGMGLTPIKMTKGGATLPQPSVDKDVMDALEETTELAAMILKCRSLQKTKSTYLLALKEMAEYFKDGRIHPQFNQFGARCMPAGELVLTNRGYLPVEKVKVGDEVMSHTGKARRVTDVHDNGVRPVLATSLDNGIVLRTTGNHPYFTSKGWKLARNLEPNDRVVVHSGPEDWTTIQQWEDFEVSSWGRIRNMKTGRLLKIQTKDKWGHLKVQLHRNGAQTRKEGDRKDLAVHRLVAQAFVPNPENYPEVRHKNGCAWDNTVRNLLWGTSKDNTQDAIAHGTTTLRYGERAKLTDDAVAEIRNTPFVRGFQREGYESREGSDYILARKFNVSREVVRDVRLGKRWQPIPHREKRARFVMAKVVSQAVLKAERTFGLTVEVDHSHVTGGVVTHNTGRLSTQSPNSQNFPRPDGDDWGIRHAFIAPPGKKLIVADYGQLEMRIMADQSGDKVMIGAIKEGKDLHSFTASRMVPGVAYEEVVAAKKADKPNQKQKMLLKLRQDAKPVGFGIIYGAGPPTISKNITITQEDIAKKLEEMPARKFKSRLKATMKKNPLLTEEQAAEKVAAHSIAGDKIEAYFKVFPRVKTFMDYIPELCRNTRFVDFPESVNLEELEDLKQVVTDEDGNKSDGRIREWGFVQTLVGRYRRLHDIAHTNYVFRGHAEREAVNTKIQGTAADMAKAAMLRIERSRKLNRLGCKLLNQIHDEVVIEVPAENAEEAGVLIKKYMEHPFGNKVETLCVPTPVDLKICDRWSEGK